MEIKEQSKGVYQILKDGKPFGEVRFWPGYDKPTITYDTPPGLTPREEEELRSLPSPLW